MGFLLNMFYSLTQQILRHDPFWYALMAAGRPDHCWRLISYPYTVKYAVLSDSTGFLHLDFNMSEYVSLGCGANTLSSSISFDPEDDKTCTFIISGFHRHIQQWQQRRIARGGDSAGTTTNCSTQYRTKDRTTWGHAGSRPCPALASTSHVQRSFTAPPLPQTTPAESSISGTLPSSKIISPLRTSGLSAGRKHATETWSYRNVE
jgi:hypothetical protein